MLDQRIKRQFPEELEGRAWQKEYDTRARSEEKVGIERIKY